MRQDIARHIERVDQKLAILDADVDVRAEDEQPLRQLAHVLPYAQVALQRRDLLIDPRGEWMGARGGDLEPVPGHQFQDLSAQSHQLGACLRRRPAHLGADLHNRLVQLRLYLRQHEVIAAQDFRDVRFQLAGLGIDDLVLLLDPQGERGRLHRGSTTNVGVCDPPPAVTLTRAAVDRRVMHPSTCVPWYAYGAVSKMRSARITRPSTTLGNGSLGIGTRACTTNGSVSAVRSAASHVAPSTSHPSTIPAPPYASFGLSTRRSRCSIMKGTGSTVRP